MELRLSHEKQMHVLNEFSEIAHRHAAEDPALVVLDIDPVKYPAQDLHTHLVEGDPQHAAVIESIATDAEPRFPDYLRYLREVESEDGTLTKVGEMLRSGGNVMVVTNHGKLIDIAVAQAAVYCTLDTMGYEMDSSIVISKMVAMLGYTLGDNAAPAAEILKMLCDDIFLSFPRTESMHKSKLLSFIPDHIDRYNKQLRESVAENFDRGGMLFAVAASGTTDKESVSDPNIIEMAPVGSGTTSWMAGKHLLVLPMAVWLKGKYPVFEIAGNPVSLYTPDIESDEGKQAASEKVTAVMRGIADTLNEHPEALGEKRYVYRAPSVGRLATGAALA